MITDNNDISQNIPSDANDEAEHLITYTAIYLSINTITRISNLAARNGLIESSTAHAVLLFGVLSALDPLYPVIFESTSPLMYLASRCYDTFFKPIPTIQLDGEMQNEKNDYVMWPFF